MERSLGNYSNKTKMIINNKEDVFVKICQEISKSKDKVDICIKTTNDFSTSSFANKFLMDIIDEIKRNTKIKTRCIVNVPQGNTNYIKQLVSLVDEVRYSHGIKDCFFINKLTYLGISINPKSQHKLHLSPQLIIIKTKSFINQQQFFFDLLWNKAIPYGQNIREIKEDKVKDRKISLPIKTEVIQKQKDLFARITEFYKNSNEIKFCSQADGIKLVYNNFFDLHEQVLDRYRKGNHKGVRWITSLNNKKDIRLIKEFIDKGGIEARHIKDLSTNSFALSDNSFLFTIEKLDKAGNNVLYSNDKLYLNHYDMVFENSWKKGIDIHERIKDIEKGHDYIDVDIIPNPQESIKIFGDLFSSATKEILLILSSINDIDRVENHDDFNKCEELISKKNIKFKVLIPSNIELDDKISYLTSKYPKIEFKSFNTFFEPSIGTTVIDREKVLLFEIKDDLKKDYFESMGMTILIEGKSAALSYTTIFDNLWKQTELYNELKKAFLHLQIHDKMQKEFINIAAHELRTPTQSILGFSKIVRDRVQDNEQKAFLSIVIKNANRLKRLTEDILDVTRIEGNKFFLKKESVCIWELLYSIMKEFGHSLESDNKRVTFKLYFKNIDLNTIFDADKNRISQVISNLINNSIKFISTENEKDRIDDISLIIEKTKLSNNSKRDISDNIANEIIISIKDNGIGIDSEIFPKLFTKFASKSFQGTGLGLYISKKIIEDHGGKIWAKNNDDGKGATFSFSIPLYHNYSDNKDKEK